MINPRWVDMPQKSISWWISQLISFNLIFSEVIKVNLDLMISNYGCQPEKKRRKKKEIILITFWIDLGYVKRYVCMWTCFCARVCVIIFEQHIVYKQYRLFSNLTG